MARPGDYGRVRAGARQRSDGSYYVSVSMVLPIAVRKLVGLLSDKRRRDAWMRDVDRDLSAGLAASLTGPAGKPFTIKDDDNARHRYKAGSVVVELLLTGRPGGKTSIVAVSSRLPDAAAVDRHRLAWRAILDRLNRHLTE
jgi:hypothetical protein